MESTDGCTVTAGIPMVSWVGPRASRVQAIAAGVVCAIALLVAAPNFFSARTVATTWPGWLPDRQIRLGIEYSGGHSLLLEPDMNFVQRELMSELRDKVRKALRETTGSL